MTASAPSPSLAIDRAFQPWAKLFVDHVDDDAFDPIGIFHRWIQTERVGELLIDVHDYRHVHHGPGVILVAHECIYGLDETAGRLGLAYKTRRGEARPPHEAIRGAAKRLLEAAIALEEDAKGALRFATDSIELGFDDRLLTPNRPDVFEALAPVVADLGRELYGAPPSIESSGQRGGCIRLEAKGQAAPLADLRARL